jgi:hypothetical protein
MRLLLIVVMMVIGPLSGQDQSAQKHQYQTQSTISATSLAGGDPATQPEKRGTADEAEHIFYDWLWEPVRLNWPLVVVGIFGVWAALRTLGTIARQTAAIEKDLVLSQRPRIIVRNLYLADTGEYGQLAIGLCVNRPIIGQLSMVNIGGTTARIVEKFCEVRIDRPLPTKPTYEGVQGIKEETVILPGAFVAERFNREEELTEPERADLQAGQRFLYVLGWIGYVDDIKIYRRMAFCRIFHTGNRRFVSTDDPDYEYSD